MTPAVTPDWLPGPAIVEPQTLSADVWRVDLEDGVQTARSLSHAALREVLARYLPDSPLGLHIGRTAEGKPYLREPAIPLRFNLSHCRDLALIVVSACCELGVDVERERPIVDPLRLARRVFSDVDLETLKSLPPNRRLSAFFDLWTQLEARQKAWGRGIFAPSVDPASVQCLTLRPTPEHYASVCGVRPDGELNLRFFGFQPLGR